MDLSTLWCYKLWKVIHTEISVTISVRGVLRWRNAALLGSRVNFKLTIFLSYLPLFSSKFANFAFQVREWTCQDTLWGKSAALGLFRCKFDSLLVSLYWSPKAFGIFIASVYFLYYIYLEYFVTFPQLCLWRVCYQRYQIRGYSESTRNHAGTGK